MGLLSVELIHLLRDFLGLIDIARFGSCSVQLHSFLEPGLYRPLCLLDSTGYELARDTEPWNKLVAQQKYLCENQDAVLTDRDVRYAAEMFLTIQQFGRELVSLGNLYLKVRPWIYRAALRCSGDNYFYDDAKLRVIQLQHLAAKPNLGDAAFRRKARRVLNETLVLPDMRPFKAYEDDLRDKYEVHIGPDFEPIRV